MPDSVLSLAAQFRRALLAEEADARRELTAAYRLAWEAIRAELERTLREMQAEGKDGPSVGDLYRLGRLERLERTAAAELSRFGLTVERTITTEQRQALEAALRDARVLIGAGMGDSMGVGVSFGGQFPAGAVQELVGFLGNGSPLREASASYGPDAAQAARETLIKGVAMGSGVRQIARELKDALDTTHQSAQRLTRTAVLNSYRGGTLATYRENSDILAGWIWHARLDSRVCGSCLALHGRRFPLSQPMREHWNGRCAQIPVLKDDPIQVETGPEWFDGQDEETQRDLLGPAKHAAWKDGAFTLDQLVGVRNDPVWGRMYGEKSLVGMLGEAAAAQYT